MVGRVVLPGNAAYAATKWALEGFVEGLATEVRHFGIQAALLQPGPVSSGALDNPQSYALPDDPYAALFAQREDRSSVMVTPEVVATAIVDAAEASALPLRVPIGDWAVRLLAARRTAPDDVPFVPMPLDW